MDLNLASSLMLKYGLRWIVVSVAIAFFAGRKPHSQTKNFAPSGVSASRSLSSSAAGRLFSAAVN